MNFDGPERKYGPSDQRRNGDSSEMRTTRLCQHCGSLTVIWFTVICGRSILGKAGWLTVVGAARTSSIHHFGS